MISYYYYYNPVLTHVQSTIMLKHGPGAGLGPALSAAG